MLISGLWKLAAMASVIGVGLVAVYQAQQKLDHTAVVAGIHRTEGDESDLLEAESNLSKVMFEQNDSSQHADPVEGLAEPEKSRSQERVVQENALSEITEDTSPLTVEHSSPPLLGPGSRFDIDVPDLSPALDSTSSQPVVQTVGVESDEPRLFSEEVDPFDSKASEPPVQNPVSKSTLNVRSGITPDNTDPDPFGTNPFVQSPPEEISDESTSPDLGDANSTEEQPARISEEPSNTSVSELPPEIPVEIFKDKSPDSSETRQPQTPRRHRPDLEVESQSLEALDTSADERVPHSQRPGPGELSPPTSNDLVGDGTVTDATPRGIQQPRLSLEKIAPKQGVLGEPLVYSVIVKNAGSNDARNVVVEDRIPMGTELTGTLPRAEMIDKTLIWRLGTMKPNEEKRLSIRVIPRQQGSIGSVARVHFSTEVAAEIIVAAPQLSLQVRAPHEVRIGETIDMTFLLKNSGGAAANNVSVRDLIPEGLKHDAASDIECPIGRLEPDESREIVLQVTAVKLGRVKNQVILSADGVVVQELDSTIDIIGEHLVLTRTGQNRIFAERRTVFTNGIKNDGNAEVKQVHVSEVVPVGMEFIEATDGGKFQETDRTIHWTIGPLPAGDEMTVKATLLAKRPGILHGLISAQGSTGNAVTVKSEVDVVGRPELQMETLNATGSVAVGDKLTSKIQLSNKGNASARNVRLSVSIPRQLKLVEVRGVQYQTEKDLIRFEPLVELNPHDTATFEIVMEAIEEADALMDLQISAEHLSKPARRQETVQIEKQVR
ncbi:MAG: hypothetical protein NTW75_01120 [Planctomycetales bacterium]|jgi:uncharacterized repeat protein (TIGR01451 family)|nr:hypothetical protein [Planctomycetales bacterium]